MPVINTRPVNFLMLRIIMLIAAVPAAAYGTAAAVHPEFMAEVARKLSNARGTMTPDMAYIAKPLGLYVAMYAYLLLFAVTNPAKYRIIIIWASILLALRAVQRLALSGELFELYQIAFTTNLAHVAWLAFLATTMFVLRPPVQSTAAMENTPADQLSAGKNTEKVLLSAHLDR